MSPTVICPHLLRLSPGMTWLGRRTWDARRIRDALSETLHLRRPSWE
jgi:hypothetical protein